MEKGGEVVKNLQSVALYYPVPKSTPLNLILIYMCNSSPKKI